MTQGTDQPAAQESNGKRLRLLKVMVQPVFVIDDGDTLAEHAVGPLPVSAADWPGYATGPFLQATDELRQQIEQGVTAER